MPIPAPGTYDVASQLTVIAIKAKTDLIGATVALEDGGNVAAIKAKTDLIGADVALETGGKIAGLESTLADSALVTNLCSGLGSLVTTAGCNAAVPGNLPNIVDSDDATFATSAGVSTSDTSVYTGTIVTDMLCPLLVREIKYKADLTYTGNGCAGPAAGVYLEVSYDGVVWLTIASRVYAAGAGAFSGTIAVGRYIRYARMRIRTDRDGACTSAVQIVVYTIEPKGRAI